MNRLAIIALSGALAIMLTACEGPENKKESTEPMQMKSVATPLKAEEAPATTSDGTPAAPDTK